MFYVDSKKIREVIENNPNDYSYGQLNSCQDKRSCMEYLYKIYCCESQEVITNIDLHNLYDICYMLSNDNFDIDTSLTRTNLAKEYISIVKEFSTHIIPPLDIYLNIKRNEIS